MKTSVTDQTLGKFLSITLLVVTIFVSPWNSVDPINLPKMTALGILSFTILGLLISKKRDIFATIDLKLRILTLVFLTQFFIAACFVSGDLAFKIYGTPHRNTGLLTYFCLTIIMLASAGIAKTSFARNFIHTLVGTSAILSVYGLAQSRGLEIFEYTSGSGVFSTFGNINFHSAFMGVAGSSLLVFALTGKKKITTKLILLLIFLLCVLNILGSSSQGFLCLAGGLTVASLVRLFSQGKNILGLIVSLFASIGAVLVTLAVFNFGPLAGLIYENSLKARGFYWEAAINMLMGRPFFGVGVDGFGDSYFRFRSKDAADFNIQLVSDSAHNIFLDIGTSGGILLLIAYLGIQVLVILGAIQRIRLKLETDGVYLSILAAWSAYQIQSLISINQIGLGIWGWATSGLLIGLGHAKRMEFSSVGKSKEKTSPNSRKKLPNHAVAFSIVGLVTGALISLPPYLAANKFYNVMQSGRIELLKDSAELWPRDRTRYFYVSRILIENNFEADAIPILQAATVRYPDYFPLWSQLAQNPKSTLIQIAKAKAEMKRLDPLNPEWK
jgi:O-antigen ligase